MVSPTPQKPKAGGSQDPNSVRKLRPRPKPGIHIEFCQKCGRLREEPTPSCAGCGAVTASTRQPAKAAADGGSDVTRTMTTEDNDDDLMDIDSGSGSNDKGKGKVSPTDANERTSAAAAAQDNSSKAGQAPVPSQGDISIQDRPPAGALPSELLSGITPWTPVDSSALTGPPPAANTHVTHMAATAGNMHASGPVGAPAIMTPGAHHASFPGSLSSAPSMEASAFACPVAMPSIAPMGQTSMSSPAVDPRVSVPFRPGGLPPPLGMTMDQFYAAAMDDSNDTGFPMMRNSIPATFSNPRRRISVRMRKRPATAARPRRQPASNPGANTLPPPAENPPVPGEPPATTSSSTAANPPSVIITAPPTTPPAEVDSTRGTASPVADSDPRSLVSAMPETTFPVSTGPALTNMPVNKSSSALSGPTCTSLPAATNALAAENLQITMDCALLNSLSAALRPEDPQMAAHIKAYGPPPTNAGSYLNNIQTNDYYTSKATDDTPMNLDPLTVRELIYLEVLVTNPPISSTSPFFMPPRSLSLYLLKLYRHEVYFTYPFFNMSEFTDAVMKFFMLITKSDASGAHLGLGCSDESNPTTCLFQCALFTMLWHALYFANIEQNDKVFASGIFWKCAKFFMTEDLVKTNCLAAVQTQLIISVALNSSSLPGNERRAPAELAYRMAQSLGMDNEKNPPTAAAADNHGADRYAWYGCVMMNLISQTRNSNLPLNSSMSKSPLTTCRHQYPAGSVDFSFFINCIIRAEELENILGDICKTHEPILKPFPDDQCDQYDMMVPVLRETLRKFAKSLPRELGWGISGLPDEYVRIGNFNDPRATSNANFMHLRAMLFRPIFMHIGIDGCPETMSPTSNIDPVVQEKTLTYALSCVNTAISLMDFLYKRYTVDIKSNREWWWSPYHISTAGLILVMAQTSATLWSHVQVESVKKAWDSCQQMLGHDAADNRFHESALRYLWSLNKQITGVSVLENNHGYLKLRLPTPAAGPSFRRTPHSQPVNPGSTSHPVNPNSDGNAPSNASRPIVFPSSLTAAPFTASASSTNFTATISSASNEMVFSESGAVANAAFANYNNTVPCAPLPNASNVPPSTASSSVNTAPYTAPSASSLIAPWNVPASTAYPVSTSSENGPSPFFWDLNMILPAALESAGVPYTAASNSMAVPSAASSENTIAPYATSSLWNTTPYATTSESATFLHTDGTNSTTAPTTTSSCVAPAPYMNPYTVFSDPNATLYTEESMNLDEAVWPDMSAFDFTLASSGTTTSLLPSDLNLADYGNMDDADGTGIEAQMFYQPFTKGFAFSISDEDPFAVGNQHS